MSRCYPYPPPGHVRNTGVLHESIKLQRQGEKVKTAIKKDKRREKKEKRKTQKQKGKTTDAAYYKVIRLTGKHEPQKPSGAESHFPYLQRSVEDEAELLEKSGITEEHGQPTWSPNGSSDTTWTSNKRKRDTSETSNARNHGTILRIRLPSKKHRGCDGALTTHNNERSFSISRGDDVFVPHKCENVEVAHEGQCRSTNATKKENVFAKELTNLKKEVSCPVPGGAESLYKALIESWVPPSLEYHGKDFDDEEWLFGRKLEHRHGSERYKAGNSISCCRSHASWPHAHYLPEADTYALPFTVPF